MPDVAPIGGELQGRRLIPSCAARVLAAAIVGAVLYAIALCALWFGQERLLLHPSSLDAGVPLSTSTDIVEETVDVPGARLSILELRLPHAKGVVFFLHGDGGNLQTWFVNDALYREANFDLVMLDYRGFGKSSGRVQSEAQLHQDIWAVWKRIEPRYEGRSVVIFGRSLGTGLAATLAEQIQPDLTVLVSPYSSMTALAREHYPWVPAAVIRYPLQTDRCLVGIRTPVLLIHGDHDDVIPLSHSRALLSAGKQVRLAVIPGAGHGDLQQFDTYRDVIRTALRAIPDSPSGHRQSVY